MWPKRYRGKWLWTVTVANVTTCALLIVLLCALIGVLAVAAGVNSWPFIVLDSLLLIGVVLTVVSYPIASMAPRRLSRWLCYGANGGALLVYLMLCSGVIWVWIHTARRLFLVPAGFQGELYLVHGSGTPQSNPSWRTTYSFPNDGVLETPREMPASSRTDINTFTPTGTY
jgi:hypothetical protein